ncbi:uncharacterized protein LOC124899580 [Capsicum annuum]|uniref:uncharacterized protein LOC124899580 n=1 Tax=Capsicum annuum TaxID=4072 RepID=UPI001FB080BB|nr:uncharacterized protein LOC124899580 [Capsicum annuum]
MAATNLDATFDRITDYIEGMKWHVERLYQLLPKLIPQNPTFLVQTPCSESFAKEDVGLDEEEKMRFWVTLDEVVRGVPSSEKIVVAGDFNGYIGALPGGFGDVHGGFVFGERNDEGAAMLEFTRSFRLVMVNSSFSKKDDHLITFPSEMAKT